MQQSTLKKLSEILGISISTVSRALKDHPDISSATKAKVKELAIAMEYEPNAYAVQLRTRQSNVLGVSVPSIRNYFYDSFIAAIEEEARQFGYSVLIMQSGDNAATEAANLQVFRKNMVVGVFAAITTGTEDMAAFQKMEDLSIPLVFADRVPELGGYTKVTMNDVEAATMAAEAIIRSGKKKVLALFGHPNLILTKLRQDAFIKTFKEQSPETELVVYNPDTTDPAHDLALEVLQRKERPDVIFCMGDLILMGVMKATFDLNLKVPKDISIISISNGFIPTLYRPQVTYVETSGYKLGKLAFKQMMARLKNQPVEETAYIESVLVEGGSL